MDTMTDPEIRRRRRPAVSCSLCRKRKIRCNRGTPCSNCLRSRNNVCLYDNLEVESPQRNVHQNQSTPESSRGGATLASNPSARRDSTLLSHRSSSLAFDLTTSSDTSSQISSQDADVVNLKLRIQQLEDQLSRTNLGHTPTPVYSAGSKIETTSSMIGGTFHVHCESGALGQPFGIARSVAHKTRLFGQSHWSVNGVLLMREIFDMIETHLRGETPRAFAGIEKCKSLARKIKIQRTPSWPFMLTSDVPPKVLSDSLIHCYFQTTESIYRVLHIPTFRRDYEMLWVSNTAPDMGFLVQLRLVLALGAVTYDEQFSLRSLAIRWVYEAQTWVSEPKFKARLNIHFMQTYLLLLFARERVGVSADSMWISAGALLRKAVYMGFHRDPSHLSQSTVFAAEMHRRLWNTVLEINLQSSLTSGGPPLISLTDFDTAPPGNFEDDQLMADNPVPKPEGSFTQSSIAIALRKTFPDRLAVVRFLNDLESTGTYQETLRLDTGLRAAYKELGRTLQACKDMGNQPSPSQFEIKTVDFLMHRYLSSLHIPYFRPALHDTAYAFSRKVVVESCLKIWRAAYPSSTLSQHESNSSSFNSDDLTRLAICSAGFYPTAAIQAAFLIAIELRAQLQEEEGLVPVALRPDLLSVLEDAKQWSLRVLEAGETNVKGYLLINIVVAHFDGLSKGLEGDRLAGVLLKATENVEDKCFPILERTDMTTQTILNDNTLIGLQNVTFATPPDATNDWGFMTTEGLFDVNSADPMSWILGDDYNDLGESFC